MGSFFSNLHVRRTEQDSGDALQRLLEELLQAQGFQPVAEAENADLSVSVYDAGGSWVSVCSDGIEFYTEESIRDICIPISERLETDVLTIACFDSDCLLLNCRNRKNGMDAWAKVGRYPGLKQRSTPAKWKGLVADVEQWKSVLGARYDFAEDALLALEPMLELAPGQGQFCPELAEEEFAADVRTFYYALPETGDKPEPPRLTIPIYGLTPCEMGEPDFIRANNVGGKSRGLAIAFSGSYVEREEIQFRDVQLEFDFDRHPRPTIPLTLEKRQTSDGKWIYYAEAPQMQLPPGVKAGLPVRKAMEEAYKKSFGVRFTPEGNARKRLDITVHFIPLRNPSGQCGWCVWWDSGSKRAFVEDHNRRCSAHQLNGVRLLDVHDLDLDD